MITPLIYVLLFLGTSAAHATWICTATISSGPRAIKPAAGAMKVQGKGETKNEASANALKICNSATNQCKSKDDSKTSKTGKVCRVIACYERNEL